MKDYLIVGLGLSGVAICEQLQKRKKSFLVYEDESQKASKVAGGIFNPVVLKRFTIAWNASAQLKRAIPFYEVLEAKLDTKFIDNSNIFRRFHSIEEQNEWFTASDDNRLAPYLDTKLFKNDNPFLNTNYSLGRVRGTGTINTSLLLKKYKNFLLQAQLLREESFEYSQIIFNEDSISYKGIEAKKVIFCEGFGLKQNPFFNYLPLQGSKGEYLIIRAPLLKLEKIIKSSSFVIPLGDHCYKVGATYNNQDKSIEVTEEARLKLIKQLKDLIKCDFEVVDQIAGLRPTVIDRRPLAGAHPKHPALLCCNGFGSRGVLIAPSLSEMLINFSEEKAAISSEVDIARFTR